MGESESVSGYYEDNGNLLTIPLKIIAFIKNKNFYPTKKNYKILKGGSVE